MNFIANTKNMPKDTRIGIFSLSSLIWAEIVQRAIEKKYVTQQSKIGLLLYPQYINKRLAARFARLTYEYLNTHTEYWSSIYEKVIVDFMAWLYKVKQYGFYIEVEYA